jgi:WD40 repeat protein
MSFFPKLSSYCHRRGLFIRTCLIVSAVLTLVALVRADPSAKNAASTGSHDMGLIRRIAVTPDGKLALGGDSNGCIEIWNLASGRLIRKLHDPSHDLCPVPIYSYAFSADGKIGLSGHDTYQWIALWPKRGIVQTLTLWDLVRGAKSRTFAITEPVRSVALSSDGKLALSATIHKIDHHDMDHAPVTFKAVRVWDTSTGRLLHTLAEGLRSGFVPVTISQDGRFAAVACGGEYESYDKVKGWDVKVWDLASGKELQCMPARESGAVTCVAFSANGRQVAAGHYDKVTVWDLATGKELWSHASGWPHWGVKSVAFSPDGLYVVAAGPETDFCCEIPKGCDKGGFQVFNATTGQEDPRVAHANEWVRSVIFSHDGKYLLGATSKGVKIWDARSGKPSRLLSNQVGTRAGQRLTLEK